MSNWREHNGGDCPVPSNFMIRWIEAEFRDGFKRETPAYDLTWNHEGNEGDIVRWRYADEGDSA